VEGDHCIDHDVSMFVYNDNSKVGSCSELVTRCSDSKVRSVCPDTCFVCDRACYDPALSGIVNSDGEPLDCESLKSSCDEPAVQERCPNTCDAPCSAVPSVQQVVALVEEVEDEEEEGMLICNLRLEYL
jgi:hypothetical protein